MHKLLKDPNLYRQPALIDSQGITTTRRSQRVPHWWQLIVEAKADLAPTSDPDALLFVSRHPQ